MYVLVHVHVHNIYRVPMCGVIVHYVGIDKTNTYPALPHIETLVFFANNAMLGGHIELF